MKIKHLYEQETRKSKQFEEDRTKLRKEYQLLLEECNKLKYQLAQALLQQRPASPVGSNTKNETIEKLEREKQDLQTELQKLREQLVSLQGRQTKEHDTIISLTKQLKAMQEQNEELKKFVDTQKIEFHEQQQQLLAQNRELNNKIKILQQQQQMKERASELIGRESASPTSTDPTVTFKLKHVVIFFALLIIYLYIR
jgi:predicted  nucleic acid-binding Zn-ribbon protein